MSANKLVVCPYDEAHKVKESRIQLHITKCRLNHSDSPIFICPFNATHVFPKLEEKYHMERCSDKAPLDRAIAGALDQNNPFKGRTAVPNYSDPIALDTDEVWDVEELDGMAPGYCPTKEVPSGAIYQPAALSKPATRRQLYKDLHQMSSDLDNRSETSTVPAPVPRQPKQPSQAERNFEEPAAVSQILGLGRGKPPSNKIAANIFSQVPKTSNTAPVQSNYSTAISGINNLSLGRSENKAPTSQSFFNDDDFPALGLGRGAAKNPPKQGFKASGPRW